MGCCHHCYSVYGSAGSPKNTTRPGPRVRDAARTNFLTSVNSRARQPHPPGKLQLAKPSKSMARATIYHHARSKLFECVMSVLGKLLCLEWRAEGHRSATRCMLSPGTMHFLFLLACGTIFPLHIQSILKSMHKDFMRSCNSYCIISTKV